MRIALIGATGGTGRLITEEARRRGHSVRALVRHRDSAQGLATDDLVVGDARSAEALSQVVEGSDAVISALGTGVSPFSEVRLLSKVTGALVAAMADASVQRLIAITGMGAGDSRGHGGFLFDPRVQAADAKARLRRQGSAGNHHTPKWPRLDDHTADSAQQPSR